MVGPRWRKVLRDIWGNKARMALIVLSVAAGIFALGTIAHMQIIVSRDLDASYQSINPADATIYIKDSYSEEALPSLRKIDGVRDVVGQYRFIARFRVGTDEKWHPIEVVAAPDYNDTRVNKISQEVTFNPDPTRWPAGHWPPHKREIVLERTSLLLSQLGLTQAQLGDMMTIETTDGHRRSIRIAGLAYDFGQIPATFAGHAYGYIDYDTLSWFGLPRALNTVYVRVDNAQADRAAVEEVTSRIRRDFERNGHVVDRIEIHEYGKLPLDYVFRAIRTILGSLGVLSLVLSTFLVINTVAALMGQQVRQIGMMKAIGARTVDLMGMYLVMVLLFGVAALVVAMPLAFQAAQMFSGFLSYFLNFRLSVFRVPPEALVFEVLVGLAVPFMAAFFPILNGMRVTVLEALQSYGLSENRFSSRYIDMVIARLPLPRPLLLSLRNTFRRQGRLILTITTLTFASAIFVTVLSLRASMSLTVDTAFEIWRYDVLLHFKQPYNVSRIEQEARKVPQVVDAEGWLETVTYRVFAGKQSSAPIVLVAVPPTTRLLQPTLIAGRWLRDGDTNMLVVDTHMLEADPSIAVGKSVVLMIRNKKTTWQVVGIVQTIGAVQFAYADYGYFSRLDKQEGRATRVQIETAGHDRATQLQVAQALEAQYQGSNIEVVDASSTADLREQSATLFNIITSLLLAMAVVLATIGGLGLTGTMSLNVLERTREIGVLRAIGASNGSILQIVIVEGLVIGFISWFLGVVLAIPLGKPLSDVLGNQFFQTPLIYSFSVVGAVVWFGLALGIATIASFIPARHAIRMSVYMALNDQ